MVCPALYRDLARGAPVASVTPEDVSAGFESAEQVAASAPVASVTPEDVSSTGFESAEQVAASVDAPPCSVPSSLHFGLPTPDFDFDASDLSAGDPFELDDDVFATNGDVTDFQANTDNTMRWPPGMTAPLSPTAAAALAWKERGGAPGNVSRNGPTLAIDPRLQNLSTSCTPAVPAAPVEHPAGRPKPRPTFRGTGNAVSSQSETVEVGGFHFPSNFPVGMVFERSRRPSILFDAFSSRPRTPSAVPTTPAAVRTSSLSSSSTQSTPTPAFSTKTAEVLSNIINATTHVPKPATGMQATSTHAVLPALPPVGDQTAPATVPRTEKTPGRTDALPTDVIVPSAPAPIVVPGSRPAAKPVKAPAGKKSAPRASAPSTENTPVYTAEPPADVIVPGPPTPIMVPGSRPATKPMKAPAGKKSVSVAQARKKESVAANAKKAAVVAQGVKKPRGRPQKVATVTPDAPIPLTDTTNALAPIPPVTDASNVPAPIPPVYTSSITNNNRARALQAAAAEKAVEAKKVAEAKAAQAAKGWIETTASDGSTVVVLTRACKQPTFTDGSLPQRQVKQTRGPKLSATEAALLARMEPEKGKGKRKVTEASKGAASKRYVLSATTRALRVT
ncbi:hypothetical protein B0H19DRAFT_1272123 [Mycena capillaripes]|nr:hypothetical protein B0H19DRAFT_1272123 [Mycena capillaripes]